MALRLLRGQGDGGVARVEHHKIIAQAVHFHERRSWGPYRRARRRFSIDLRRAKIPKLARSNPRNRHAHLAQPDRSCCSSLPQEPLP